jgi:hypothetical protein
VLLCIAHDPGVRLRDIAARVGHYRAQRLRDRHRPDRSCYVVKEKDGRGNRYQIQPHLPLPGPASQGPATGEVLALLTGVGKEGQELTGTGPA